MKKHFICVSIYTADKKLCKYEFFFCEKSKNRDKAIQSGTAEQHNKKRDYPSKIGTVAMLVISGSGNTLELDAAVHWEAKNELNRLVFSLKFDIALPLSKIGGILGIVLLLRN